MTLTIIDHRTIAVINKLGMFACLRLLGFVGSARADLLDERGARLAVKDAYLAFELTDAEILEAHGDV